MEEHRPASLKAGYHHGDLKAALLAAAELVLAERGIEGFTLRECARRAGVSHAAPAHHFGDVAGLLTAVAVLGFETLTASMRQARAGIDDPADRLRAIGRGYVTFARHYPERFRLAFNRHCLNTDDPNLRAAGREAFGELEIAIRLLTGAGDEPLSDDRLTVLLHTWSVVHGYAHLILAGQLDRHLEGRGEDAITLALEGVLARLVSP
ncbi:TetR/AcrR family transcriptional regulator [Labrys neptuniae]